MTRLRWTEPANADFLGIMEWLKAKNPAAAARVGRHILDDVERLPQFPYLGKPGRSPDTRELGVGRYPYLIVYSVEHDTAVSKQPQTIVILRVLHGAMLWPPRIKARNER
jgi:toxin ParE1/3/4